MYHPRRPRVIDAVARHAADFDRIIRCVIGDVEKIAVPCIFDFHFHAAMADRLIRHFFTGPAAAGMHRLIQAKRFQRLTSTLNHPRSDAAQARWHPDSLSISSRISQWRSAHACCALFLSFFLKTQEPGRGISLYWSLVMKKKNLSLIIVMLSLAGCGGGNGNDNLSSTSGGSTATLGSSVTVDTAAVNSAQFLMDAYRDGLSEIQLSQLALQKAADSKVRSFAQRMIDDHTRLNNEITQLAQSKNIALPTDLSPEQKAQADRLAALSGDEFDRAYMAGNVVVHRQDVTAARQQAEQGTDADVRMLADSALPILEIHLFAAEEINGLLDPLAFLATAYQDGLAEIGLSRLALQKAMHADVQQFAQRMIDDHTQANDRIADLAQQKDVALPDAPASEQQAVIDALAKFSGADFDKAYMDGNVVIHVKDVRQVRQQSEQGRDPEVKSLAQQVLPVLESHLASAIDIDRRIEPSFLYSAYRDGKAEIKLAHLVLMQGANEQVKSFAQQMITDYTAANARIRQLAQQQDLALPMEMSPEQLRDFVELMGKSGAEFDRQYMEINVQNQRKAVTEATEQTQAAVDASIKALVQDVLPVLTTHLQRAQEILPQ